MVCIETHISKSKMTQLPCLIQFCKRKGSGCFNDKYYFVAKFRDDRPTKVTCSVETSLTIEQYTFYLFEREQTLLNYNHFAKEALHHQSVKQRKRSSKCNVNDKM